MTDTTQSNSSADLFLDGLVKIVTDLDKGGTKDPEMLARIGSLADRLITRTETEDWSAFKKGLGADERKSIVGTFSREIEDSGNSGDIRTAYAMQAIAASIIGDGFNDERITPGVGLLDRYITAARNFYVRNAPKPN